MQFVPLERTVSMGGAPELQLFVVALDHLLKADSSMRGLVQPCGCTRAQRPGLRVRTHAGLWACARVHRSALPGSPLSAVVSDDGVYW